ncbi:MAG: DUF2961 domain-containing protein [bacterium]
MRVLSGLAMAVAVGGGVSVSAAEHAPAEAGGLPAIKNPAVVWESLPSIRTGVKIWSHTSKNALNCTIMDWTNYTLQDTDGYEQASVKGVSGMLVHSWFAWLSGPGGNLKLFLSAGAKPDYDMPFADYFKAGKAPHLLWFNQDGCIWSAFPCLPFDSTFKAVLADKRPDWYQYTLHLYREGRFAEIITQENLKALRAKINSPGGAFPGADPGNCAKTNAVTLGASQSVALFDCNKSGVVRSIRIAMPSAAAGAMDMFSIRITTDGAVTADLPVPMFFGGYLNIDMRNARGLPAGYDGKLYCYFPMPFWKSMKIELVNRQNAPVQAACEIGWSDRNPYPEASTGVFKVQFNNNVPVKAGEPDFANLDVEGSGTLVGCVSKLAGDIEGNFSIFTDGSKTPAVETTGGEDYFNHAYGIHPGVFNAFSGGLAGGTGYRFHILDYVPFQSSIRCTQDHAHGFTHDRDGTFLSAVYYYHTPKKFLVLTDELDVGKPASESAHAYRAEGAKERARLQADKAGYEGNHCGLIPDEGRWTDKGSRFTVKVNKDNDGVRLRRRTNQMAYHQEAEVYVDGKLAGTWFDQGANIVLNYDHAPYKALVKERFAKDKQEVPSWENGTMPSQFRDIEFEIPAALTRGKKALDIKLVAKGSLGVKPADAGLINEYYYWAYSYVR